MRSLLLVVVVFTIGCSGRSAQDIAGGKQALQDKIAEITSEIESTRDQLVMLEKADKLVTDSTGDGLETKADMREKWENEIAKLDQELQYARRKLKVLYGEGDFEVTE